MTDPRLGFGVNLNNREPLIAPDYDLQMLLDLSEVVEARGFDSVWVGDSLFSKPRYEPITLLAAISQRTSHVKLGTACLVSSTRNPLYLALEWATLDHVSGGRTILGAGAGNPEEGVRREFEALGLDFARRSATFEEGLAVLRSLWTEGAVTFHGTYFDYDDVSFYSGTEMGPLMPIQQPPPMWIVSNPRLTGDAPPDVMRRRLEAACRRIVRYGDGWLTCCRAQHPEELREQLDWIERTADELGEEFSRLTIAYQVTMNIGDSKRRRARRSATTSRSTTPSCRRRWTCPTGGRSEPRTRSRTGCEPSLTPASTTSSAASGRSTSLARWSASRARFFPSSLPSE